MKAGKTADDYRMKTWDHRKGGDYKHHPVTIEGAPGGTVPYPRHVKDAEGNTHVVQNAAHEAQITGVQEEDAA